MEKERREEQKKHELKLENLFGDVKILQTNILSEKRRADSATQRNAEMAKRIDEISALHHSAAQESVQLRVEVHRHAAEARRLQEAAFHANVTAQHRDQSSSFQSDQLQRQCSELLETVALQEKSLARLRKQAGSVFGVLVFLLLYHLLATRLVCRSLVFPPLTQAPSPTPHPNRNSELERSKATLTGQVQENESASEDLDRTRRELKAAQDELVRVSNEKAEIVNALAEAQFQVGSLQSSTELANEVLSEVGMLRAKKRELEADNEDLYRKVDSLKALLEPQAEMMETMSAEIQSLINEERKLKEANAQLTAMRDSMIGAAAMTATL